MRISSRRWSSSCSVRPATASPISRRSPRRATPLKSGTYAMVGATIVDGTGRSARSATASSLVRGRPHRRRRSARARSRFPAGCRGRVDGKTIVPGLWDMHTHVTQIEWAPVYLGAGVTTVRDMGNEFEFIVAAARRDRVDARARPAICSPPDSIDGGGPNAFGVYYAATPEEAKQVVGRYHDAGFQQIKIYSLVTPPIVEAISAEAHRLGMTVTGHVPNGMTIEQAAAAGMDQIAHLADSRRGRVGRGEQHDCVAQGAQDRDGSDAVVERTARPRGRHADRGVPAGRREDSAAAQPAVLERRCCRHRRRRGRAAASSAACGSSRRFTMPVCPWWSAPTKGFPGTASIARSSCTSRRG